MALKYFLTIACLLMNFIEQNQAITCSGVSGSLKQIDAGVGMVVGVNSADRIYALFGSRWTQLPGRLKHVSVGHAGVWGVTSDNHIFKLVGADWVHVPGLLSQVDAGGDQFVVGVNHHNRVFCMNRNANVKFSTPSSPAPWQDVPGLLIYYSCGPMGCWGVNRNRHIFYRGQISDVDCVGHADWQLIDGLLVMVEVGTDGSVYGVNHHNDVFRRDGITDCNPAGTGWTCLSQVGKAKHVSYDLGHLWVITPNDQIKDCVV